MTHKQQIMKWFSEGNQDLRQSDYDRRVSELSALIDTLIDSCPKGCKIVGQAAQEPDCDSPDVEIWKKTEKGAV